VLRSKTKCVPNYKGTLQILCRHGFGTRLEFTMLLLRVFSADSTQRAARRRELTNLFCLFHARFPQAYNIPVQERNDLQFSQLRAELITVRIPRLFYVSLSLPRDTGSSIDSSFSCNKLALETNDASNSDISPPTDTETETNRRSLHRSSNDSAWDLVEVTISTKSPPSPNPTFFPAVLINLSAP